MISQMQKKQPLGGLNTAVFLLVTDALVSYDLVYSCTSPVYVTAVFSVTLLCILSLCNFAVKHRERPFVIRMMPLLCILCAIITCARLICFCNTLASADNPYNTAFFSFAVPIVAGVAAVYCTLSGNTTLYRASMLTAPFFAATILVVVAASLKTDHAFAAFYPLNKTTLLSDTHNAICTGIFCGFEILPLYLACPKSTLNAEKSSFKGKYALVACVASCLACTLCIKHYYNNLAMPHTNIVSTMLDTAFDVELGTVPLFAASVGIILRLSTCFLLCKRTAEVLSIPFIATDFSRRK